MSDRDMKLERFLRLDLKRQLEAMLFELKRKALLGEGLSPDQLERIIGALDHLNKGTDIALANFCNDRQGEFETGNVIRLARTIADAS